MVSEGVDIPRLRVGVYATNTITELFFRQAVGRLVRWNAQQPRQAAYMFIPDDIRLRKFSGANRRAAPPQPRKTERRPRPRRPRPGRARGPHGDRARSLRAAVAVRADLGDATRRARAAARGGARVRARQRRRRRDPGLRRLRRRHGSHERPRRRARPHAEADPTARAGANHPRTARSPAVVSSARTTAKPCAISSTSRARRTRTSTPS